jgi:hypothetical protein
MKYNLTTPYIFKVLKIARDVRQILPGAHIGGSVGLFLHGLVLDRPWHTGPVDLDLTIPHEPTPEEFKALCEIMIFDGTKGESQDMDLKFIDEKDHIKVEMQVDAESLAVIVPYMRCEYKVKVVDGILHWKEHYANLYQEEKHINDLRLILNGWSPAEIPQFEF